MPALRYLGCSGPGNVLPSEIVHAMAAQLGANGAILGDVSDRETGAVGTGVGSSSYSANSAVGVGVGGSLGIYKKSAKGRAIYVPPN